MGCFQVRYDSRVVIYERKLFIRLATAVEWYFLPCSECSLSGPICHKQILATLKTWTLIWLKMFMWLKTSNQNALFQCSIQFCYLCKSLFTTLVPALVDVALYMNFNIFKNCVSSFQTTLNNFWDFWSPQKICKKFEYFLEEPSTHLIQKITFKSKRTRYLSCEITYIVFPYWLFTHYNEQKDQKWAGTSV